MQLTELKPRKALNKAFLKVKPNRTEIERFKTNLISLLDRTNDTESEEFHKNLIIDFLKKTYYDPQHFINTKGRNDLVIHNGPTAASTVGVIIETKKPTNKAEMMTPKKLNVKAFQELVLYYLRERITHANVEVKHLVATNINEWFIFDATLFDRLFAQNKNLVNQFNDFEAGRLADTKTDFFYKQIAEPFINSITTEIEFTYFNFKDYNKAVRNTDKADDTALIALFKLLSPEHLLKLSFANDSNSLDKRFYSELLHIIGLVETKEGSKKLIERHKAEERHTGTLLENAIIQLDSLDKISRLPKPSQFGTTQEERLFNVALELTITWVNRILFLKLLEAQLITYHNGDTSYSFLHPDKIKNYDDLNSLFFQVLARKYDERNEDVKDLFQKVPYLNSSLFEPTDIEQVTLFISNLRDDKTIPIFGLTVLKDQHGKKRTGSLSTLQYLFEFLDAYDFGAEGGEEIQEDNKTLINASVLGLIFEKINGYKDGSFFTPGFITMYMCRETIRKAVVQKFNEAKNWNCTTIDELYNKIENRKEANEIVNSIKICDPAVGSGHFLVSALNEMIAVKNDLRILVDRDGKRLKEYHVEVVNDELIITDDEGELFEYNPNNKESQRLQETLFHEKQTIIENCLFGVDINPNSVKICRLRLWIELLKNAYYKNSTELETLPNIDINIKCGNSLVSRFAITADLKEALSKSKWTIDSYKTAVATYRNAENKEQKREMEQLIATIKNDFRSEIEKPFKKKLSEARGKVESLSQKILNLKSFGEKADKKLIEAHAAAVKLLDSLEKERDETESNKIFENAFEWRFEFPEVLNDEGDFVGFDVVIGNPPYFALSKIKEQSDYFSKANYVTYSKGADIYCLFYELGGNILKPFGLLTYITSNSWLRAIYGEPLKMYFVEKLQPIILINIEDIQVFEEATVESNIITLQKSNKSKPIKVVNLSKDYSIGNSLHEYFNKYSFEFIPLSNSEWFIGDQVAGKLKRKIEDGKKLLKDFNVRINFGIKTGFNEAFIINESKKNELIKADKKNAEIIKPIIRGRDLKKYFYEYQNLWVISTFPSLKIDIESFPAVKNHFLEIGKKRLEQSGEQGSRKKTANKWFETQDSISYWKDFENPKIVWGEISDKPKFAFDDEKYFAEATTFLMTGEKLKFLLAILNSKVSEWYFNLIGTTTGMGTNRWKKYKIELLPIKIATQKQENEIEVLVNQILAIKKQNPSTNTTDIENQIDNLVYQLYDLTEDEIKIVEGKYNAS
ncbi:TaqI-like C-terminal specificity domain-containing protein [Lacibacter sp. MH-610]|uniref:class I SAM-dependent DNA methyltransferase n=1 Tax=Lacibacter sp. MH-610 TaxID=3020883 RepID=UPI0038927144